MAVRVEYKKLSTGDGVWSMTIKRSPCKRCNALLIIHENGIDEITVRRQQKVVLRSKIALLTNYFRTKFLESFFIEYNLHQLQTVNVVSFYFFLQSRYYNPVSHSLNVLSNSAIIRMANGGFFPVVMELWFLVRTN